MPFVKRQRTYYKDGVEVPESSITDFGSTKYYKNIVTTKYWKEITTGSKELAYACYKTDFSEDYAYVKLPIGSDKTQYKTASNGKANNPSELISGSKLTSVTENEIEMYLGAGFGSIFWHRLPEGDLHIDTTVTETVEGTPEDYTYTTEEITPVEVTANDEYDYTEFVPSTQYDYHVDSNKLYQLAANKRTYYKYKYQDFVQPKLTANGTLGGKSFAVAVDSRYDDYSAYKALDGDTSTSWQSNGTTAAGTYFKMYNPNPLNITKIVWSGTPKYGTITAGIVYGSNDDVDYVELATFSGGTTSGGTMDLSSNTNYYKYYKITPTTWTDNSGTHTNGWAELTITAQEQIAVEVNLNGEDIYEDWEQPVLTGNGTMGGDKFAVNSIATDSNYPAYKSFDGDRSGWGAIFYKTSGYLEFYNPNPLKVSSLNILNFAGDSYGVRSIKKGYIQASNDGTEYKTIKEFTNDIVGGGQNWNIDLSDNANGYKYYRIVATDTSYADSNAANQTVITELTITAKELAKVGGTIEDADTYTDRLVSYAPIVRGKRSYYKQSEKQQDTGTYTFTLDKDYTAKLLFVGNGGGGCSSQKDSRWHYSSGGSGACFEGTVRLPADTYTLTIGSLGYGNNANNTHYHSSSAVSTDSFLTNSAGQELIRVGAGGNGYTSVGGVGGAAGVLTLGTLDILETKKAKDGVYTAGNTSAGSLSAYDGTYSGYGAGTCGTRGAGNVYGIKGIFDLVLETDINDFDWYVDVATKIY